MIISVYLTNKIINYRIPSNISGSFSFDPDNNENKLINIEAKDGKWVLYTTDDTSIIINQKAYEMVPLKYNEFYILKRKEQFYLIYINIIENQNISAYQYNTNIYLSIGRNNKANIQYMCPYLTNDSLVTITFIKNQFQLETQNTSIIYINKIGTQKNTVYFNMGDEIEIYGLRLIFLRGILIVISANDTLKIDYQATHLSPMQFPKEDITNLEIKDTNLYTEADYYSKAPRIRRSIKAKELKISAPPSTSIQKDLPLILIVGPMLTMGVTSGSMLINNILDIQNGKTTVKEAGPSLLMSGAMLASMLVWPLIIRVYNNYRKKKERKRNIAKYNKYLKEKEKFLLNESQSQRVILFENLLNVEQCLKTIATKTMNFWDKRIDQSDFLLLRIGIGNVPLQIKIDYSEDEFSIEDNELRIAAEQLINKYKYLENVPVSYSFFESRETAIMGKLSKVIPFINNLITQIITFYTYEDVKIIFFTNENHQPFWEYLKYLNHCFNNERSIRFFATESESIKHIADFINYELQIRLNRQTQDDKPPTPYYVIFIDGSEELKKYDFLQTISENEDNLGFSLIFIENKLSKLPSKCNNFIALGDKESEILKNSYEEQEHLIFYDEIRSDVDMMRLTKILANIPIEFENGFKQLPDAITFLEMEKVGKVEQLNILNRWNTFDPTVSLKAPVGVDEQGDTMYLDLHESFHGPHGLIAGMTGSGKSEFIITYILAMAVNYSPYDVSFILIDYKGGGLAFAFENRVQNIILPHLAGTITNLDKAEMDRTLVSIDSEIKRRQKIFNQARSELGESTIDIYKYQKNFKEGKLKEPISHLFIICDEFAELKAQQPEFMDNLISVARIGRSLGVHLILATQKPSGVVNDQIWSNTKFRVCLKVQDESDSREMLKRPEAAHLKQTGRFYLQVGYDEYFALGQSGYCGAIYFPSEKIVKQVDKSINFIDDSGSFIKSIQASTEKKAQAQGEQISAVLKEIIKVSNLTNIKAKRLWLENLPNIILSDDLQQKYLFEKKPFEVQAILGEYDAPGKQEQGPVIYDLVENGNTIIYGNDGTEREMLLDSLIYFTTKNYTVSELNYYIIDYGSEALRRYANLPHVGGLVFLGEEEKYTNLWKLIKKEIRTRKKLFSDYNGEYKTYNQMNTQKLPLIVVILNNFDAIHESDDNLYDYVPEITRDSDRYGVVFIITANGSNSVYLKIQQNFTNIYALKLKDVGEYMNVFNSRERIMPRDILGRGICFQESLNEFQVASIVKADDNLTSFITNFIEEQKAQNTSKARPIPELPNIVRQENVESANHGLESVAIGINHNELDIVTLNFANVQSYTISSNKIENTTNTVLSLIEELNKIKNIYFLILDPIQSLKLNANYPNYYQNDFDALIDKLNEFVNDLITKKQNTQGLIIINGLDKFVQKISDKKKIEKLIEGIKKYEKICLVFIEGNNKLKNYMYEAWFNNIRNNSTGLWIGRGVSDQQAIRVSNITKEMMKNYPNDMGFVIEDGLSTLVKLIDFISVEGSESDE